MFKKVACAVASFLIVALATNALAQGKSAPVDYPRKPINTLMGFAPGGGSDVMLSMVRSQVEKLLKTTLVPVYISLGPAVTLPPLNSPIPNPTATRSSSPAPR